MMSKKTLALASNLSLPHVVTSLVEDAANDRDDVAYLTISGLDMFTVAKKTI